MNVWAEPTEDPAQLNFVLASNTEYPETSLIGSVNLKVPGNHNVQNSLAATCAVLASTLTTDIDNLFPAIIGGLESFTGTGRRFERLGEVGDIAVVDDYAHHPTEIRATLQAARQAFPNRRIVAIYQPHLPSRTRDFLDGFADALSGADALYLTDIYLAREPEQPGLIETLAEKAGAALVKDRFALPQTLLAELKPGDVALFMGAGNIREQAEKYLNLLQSRSYFVAERP
jgi:UDP-N-acetylmuramate--alanine ligase